jgi:hypothetical protein
MLDSTRLAVGGLQLRTCLNGVHPLIMEVPPVFEPARHKKTDAGWSSQVAREAHNLEVAGSNPVPAIFLNTGHHQVACFHLR